MGLPDSTWIVQKRANFQNSTSGIPIFDRMQGDPSVGRMINVPLVSLAVQSGSHPRTNPIPVERHQFRDVQRLVVERELGGIGRPLLIPPDPTLSARAEKKILLPIQVACGASAPVWPEPFKAIDPLARPERCWGLTRTVRPSAGTGDQWTIPASPASPARRSRPRPSTGCSCGSVVVRRRATRLGPDSELGATDQLGKMYRVGTT